MPFPVSSVSGTQESVFQAGLQLIIKIKTLFILKGQSVGGGEGGGEWQQQNFELFIIANCFCYPLVSKFMRCLSKKNIMLKKPPNIVIKVLDVEWETAGRYVRPPASNENPESNCNVPRVYTVPILSAQCSYSE